MRHSKVLGVDARHVSDAHKKKGEEGKNQSKFDGCLPRACGCDVLLTPALFKIMRLVSGTNAEQAHAGLSNLTRTANTFPPTCKALPTTGIATTTVVQAPGSGAKAYE